MGRSFSRYCSYCIFGMLLRSNGPVILHSFRFNSEGLTGITIVICQGFEFVLIALNVDAVLLVQADAGMACTSGCRAYFSSCLFYWTFLVLFVLFFASLSSICFVSSSGFFSSCSASSVFFCLSLFLTVPRPLLLFLSYFIFFDLQFARFFTFTTFFFFRFVLAFLSPFFLNPIIGWERRKMIRTKSGIRGSPFYLIFLSLRW